MRIISKVESFYTFEIQDLSHLKLLRSAEQNVIFIFKMPSNVQKLSRPSVCHQVVSLKAEKTNQDPCNPLSLGSSEWSKSCILERRFKYIKLYMYQAWMYLVNEASKNDILFDGQSMHYCSRYNHYNLSQYFWGKARSRFKIKLTKLMKHFFKI